MIGKRWGSGESDEENLERMRSILSFKTLTNWKRCGGSIEFKSSQSVRGFEDDSVTSIVSVNDSLNNAVQSF